MNVQQVAVFPFRPEEMRQEWNDFVITSLKPCPVVMFARLSLKEHLMVHTRYQRYRRDGSIFLSDMKAYEKLDGNRISQAKRDLEKSLNKFFFGKAFTRFPDKRIRFFSWLHNEPQTHLHFLFELPDGNDRATEDRVGGRVKNAFTTNPWFEAQAYCEPVKSIEAAVLYSSRGAAEPVI